MQRGVSKAGFRNLRSLVVRVNIALPGESHPAMNLNAPIADHPARVARAHFGDGNGGARTG